MLPHKLKSICLALSITPWPNGLAVWRTVSQRRISTCVQLAFCLATHLLALNLVEIEFVRKLTQAFQCLATQRKSTQVDYKTSYICVKFTTFCKLHELASRLASPFGQGIILS